MLSLNSLLKFRNAEDAKLVSSTDGPDKACQDDTSGAVKPNVSDIIQPLSDQLIWYREVSEVHERL